MNLNNNKPIYLEIVNEYIKYIQLGIYKPNDKLPSVRNLAEDLGINPNTVQRSYKILEDNGYIVTIPKKGIYVSSNINQDNQKIKNIKNQIEGFKKASLTKQQLLEIIDEVYHD